MFQRAPVAEGEERLPFLGLDVLLTTHRSLNTRDGPNAQPRSLWDVDSFVMVEAARVARVARLELPRPGLAAARFDGRGVPCVAGLGGTLDRESHVDVKPWTRPSAGVL